MMNMNNLAQTHEILTPQLATKVGLTKFEFYKYVKANEYEQVGHGVYRETQDYKTSILSTAKALKLSKAAAEIQSGKKTENRADRRASVGGGSSLCRCAFQNVLRFTLYL